MKTIKIRRPVEVVEFNWSKFPQFKYMIVDCFDQPLIQVGELLTAMCLKQKINASKGKICLELEHIEVLKRIPELQKKQKEAEKANIIANDPNLYPEDFGIDPDKAKYIHKREIDAGKVSKDAYRKPNKEEIN